MVGRPASADGSRSSGRGQARVPIDSAGSGVQARRLAGLLRSTSSSASKSRLVRRCDR